MLTREEWNRMNDARKMAAQANVRELLEKEAARRAHLARVDVEGPLYKLAEAEARVRKELSDASA